MSRIAVRLVGVSKRYPGPPAHTALASVDVRIQAGIHTALTGPSGSGKSTLLNLIGGLDVATAGSVEVAGVDLSSATRLQRAAFRRSKLAFVFQQFHLLPGRSVVENVELALLCHDGRRRRWHRERAHEVLTQVDLQDRWHAVPEQLSGGEQQRVAIARALSCGPEILIMDEPTGNLDAGSASRVLTIVDNVVEEGLTVLTATHDPEVSEHSTVNLKLRNGGLQ